MGYTGKNKKNRVSWNSPGELWPNAQTAFAFSAPTWFLIADHRSAEFRFMQENVVRTLGPPKPARAWLCRQFNRISTH
jgi:hypothetical protein